LSGGPEAGYGTIINCSEIRCAWIGGLMGLEVHSLVTKETGEPVGYHALMDADGKVISVVKRDEYILHGAIEDKLRAAIIESAYDYTFSSKILGEWDDGASAVIQFDFVTPAHAEQRLALSLWVENRIATGDVTIYSGVRDRHGIPTGSHNEFVFVMAPMTTRKMGDVDTGFAKWVGAIDSLWTENIIPWVLRIKTMTCHIDELNETIEATTNVPAKYTQQAYNAVKEFRVSPTCWDYMVMLSLAIDAYTPKRATALDWRMRANAPIRKLLKREGD
jgi:hypothetical protein